jgi:CRP-like cAMP-binding protein
MNFNEPNANEIANDPPKHSIIATRRDERARRFGEVHAYERGEAIVVAGDASPGVIVILCGKIDVTQRTPSESRTLIVTHERGGFMGADSGPSRTVIPAHLRTAFR